MHSRTEGGSGHGQTGRLEKDTGDSLRIADSFASSSTLNGRLKTATPPIQPVKPTLRLLWITRPMVNGPPLPSFGGE
jgi:hypothetical protein